MSVQGAVEPIFARQGNGSEEKHQKKIYGFEKERESKQERKREEGIAIILPHIPYSIFFLRQKFLSCSKEKTRNQATLTYEREELYPIHGYHDRKSKNGQCTGNSPHLPSE